MGLSRTEQTAKRQVKFKRRGVFLPQEKGETPCRAASSVGDRRERKKERKKKACYLAPRKEAIIDPYASEYMLHVTLSHETQDKSIFTILKIYIFR